MSKTILRNMIDAIINKNDAQARVHFKQVALQKVQGILNPGAVETPTLDDVNDVDLDVKDKPKEK